MGSWSNRAAHRGAEESEQLLEEEEGERLLSIHITIDDFGGNMNVVKSNHNILNTLFVKGRHYQISTALLPQRFRPASPTIRYNYRESEKNEGQYCV